MNRKTPKRFSNVWALQLSAPCGRANILEKIAQRKHGNVFRLLDVHPQISTDGHGQIM